jgi:hypothetical protein
MPLTFYTWTVITLCALSGSTMAMAGIRRFIVFPFSLVVCLYLVNPRPFQAVPFVQVWSLFDDVGGRSGYAITPGLWFGSDGPNTALLQSYAGPLNPNWLYLGPLSPYVRDGDDRVFSRSIIRDEHFAAILRMLPDDGARVTVVRALTDPENRLRVHQSLLLTCLYELGYPPGIAPEDWWSHQEHIFRAEHDPMMAAATTQGWLRKIESTYIDRQASSIPRQCRAARLQENGSWGGHPDFGEAFMAIESGRTAMQPPADALGAPVMWWP